MDSFVNTKQFKAPFALLFSDWDADNDHTGRLEKSIPSSVEVVTVTDGMSPDAYAYDRRD